MSIVKSIKSFTGTMDRTFPLNPATYRGLMGDLFLPGGQGPIQQFVYENHASSLIAYNRCPQLNAVINKKAQAYVNGKTWIMDKKGKESNSAFAKKLKARLVKPNPFQSWKQFEAQNYIYQQRAGFCLVLPIIPTGWKGAINSTSIWNIPPEIIRITETRKPFMEVAISTKLSEIISEIKISYNGDNSLLDVDSVYIFRDWTPGTTSLFLPDSRTKVLSDPINNIIGAYESRRMLIDSRGSMGILSSGGDKYGYIPIKPTEKEDLQKDFKRYGLRQSQWKFIITSAAVQWQAMGIPTKDLMLFEEIEDDACAICDEYNYPPYLMGVIKNNSTFNNVSEAKQSLYQDTTIPEAETIYEFWNQMFDCEENEVEMQKDYSHIAVLQEDKVNKGRARLYDNQALLIMWQNNLLTANQWLEEAGMDTVTGWDIYYSDWVKLGMTFGSNPAPVQVAPTTAEQPPNEGNKDLNKNIVKKMIVDALQSSESDIKRNVASAVNEARKNLNAGLQFDIEQTIQRMFPKK